MHKIIIALAIVVLAAGSAVAQKADIMKSVNQFVDGFNKGDIRTAIAACAEQTSIIDEFPPHEWHGVGACQNWANDFDADAKKNGITDGIVTLGKPKYIDISGDRAYVVIPSNYAFKQKGKPVRETGSMFTFALQKTNAGWRITGWSWAKN
jgi:hypothetical protein